MPATVGANGGETIELGSDTGTVDLASTTFPVQVWSLGGKRRKVIVPPIEAVPPVRTAVSVSDPAPAATDGEAVVVSFGVTSVTSTDSAPQVVLVER